jgi:poly(3-hydroxybutyrate) depolymerase
MKLILSILSILLLSLSFAYAGTITLVQNFGSNPGEIKMYKYVPENVHSNAPLVVSLHGCLQDAETYSNVGWKELADKWKFYIVFPEQNIDNNPYRCWNWFQSDDIRRGHGETKSIIEMIDKMKTDYSIDDSRIYIEGLSAGGWMVPAILASYPDVFAGGATNAGGPAFCALTEKYFWDFFGWWNLYVGGWRSKKCMDGIDKLPSEWGDLVRNKGYSGYSGSWPIISIWQGSADRTVNKINQQELVEQWTNVHGIDLMFDREEKLDADSGVIHKEYHNSEGKVLVETYLISGMKHGAPIAADSEHSCGEESEYILNEGICGVRQIGLFWGLNK